MHRLPVLAWLVPSSCAVHHDRVWTSHFVIENHVFRSRFPTSHLHK
jgi:poly(A) polymerase Pap1